MKWVVDASVAIKWAIDEEGHTPARSLLIGATELVGPDFIRVELSNILWKKVVRHEITAVQAHAALPGVTNAFARFVSAQSLLPRALEMAIELAHPVYDCIYLATAEAESARLVSADLRLLKALKGTPHDAIGVALDEFEL